MAKNVINSLVFPFFEDDARESAAHAPTDSKRDCESKKMEPNVFCTLNCTF